MLGFVLFLFDSKSQPLISSIHTIYFYLKAVSSDSAFLFPSVFGGGSLIFKNKSTFLLLTLVY